MANEEKKIVYVLLDAVVAVVAVFSSVNSAKMYLLEEYNSKEDYKDVAVIEKPYADVIKLIVTFTFRGGTSTYKSVWDLEEHELQGE